MRPPHPAATRSTTTTSGTARSSRRSPGHAGRLLLAGSAAVALLGACTSAEPPPSSGATGATTAATGSSTVLRPEVAGPIALGNGRSIYLECQGNGGPTVVLVGGLGERADDWMVTTDPAQRDHAVFAEVAEQTRVCAYDRPGTATQSDAGWELSRSTPVPEPATVADSAADLNLLLAASGEAGPYVLVGHSLGGPIVRIYAGQHPTDVAAIVLDDGLSEDLGQGLTPDQVTSFEALNDPVAQGRPPGSEETMYTAAVVPQLLAAPPAPDVPVIVLSADQWPFTADVIAAGDFPPFVTVELTDALWASQLHAQDLLAATFPGATHVTETHAGHYIHHDQPQLVVDSILEVVDQVGATTPGS